MGEKMGKRGEREKKGVSQQRTEEFRRVQQQSFRVGGRGRWRKWRGCWEYRAGLFINGASVMVELEW